MLITEDLMAPAADPGVQLHVPVRHWVEALGELICGS